MSGSRSRAWLAVAAALALVLLCGPALAADPLDPAAAEMAEGTPAGDFAPDETGAAPPAEPGFELPFAALAGGQGLADVIKILLFLSVLTLLPALVLTMTSFTRIIIVLSFVRRAIGLQQLPPNTILIGLSLFLTAFLMAPIWRKVNADAIQPVMEKTVSEEEGLKRAVVPLRQFMMRHTRRKDLALFLKVAHLPKPQTAGDVPTHVLIPAFAISEIKTAFLMGFVVFLPMLIVDLVIATLLASMGMFMLPPIMISMPLKILLFVLVDGWHLVIGSLVKSFQVIS